MTSYDAAVYRETLRCENNAKAEWIKQHGSDNKVFAPDSVKVRNACHPLSVCLRVELGFAEFAGTACLCVSRARHGGAAAAAAAATSTSSFA